MTGKSRPRLLPVEVQTLNNGISCLINKMKELLEANPNDPELVWNLVCAKRMRARLNRLITIQSSSAPTQIMLEALVPLDTEDPKYVRAIEAITLLPNVGDAFRAFKILKECSTYDLIRWYDYDENNVHIGPHYAVEDVMLLAKYLKEFRC